MSLGDFLGCIFIFLKLIGYIEWSWWWILSPFWIEILIYIFASLYFILKEEEN